MKRVYDDDTIDQGKLMVSLFPIFKLIATRDQMLHLKRLHDINDRIDYMQEIIRLSNDRFVDLPPEIILEILKYFTTPELQMICRLSSFFANICTQDDLVRREAERGRVELWGNQNIQLPRIYRRALSVACGNEFTVILMDDGLPYACGENTRGQLGREPRAGQYDWRLIPIPRARNITAVACGRQHTLLLNRNGAIFTCGFGYNGSLGDGIEGQHSHHQIRQIPCPQPIVAICSSYWHNLLLDANGMVYVFGNNTQSQLGFGLITRLLIPTVLPAETFPEPITAISSGEECSLFLARTSGNIYGCGIDTYGMLSLGLGRYYTPQQIPNVPGPVAQIACGNFHSMILLQNGELYAAGKGFEGQLSIGEVILRRRTFQLMNNVVGPVSTIIAQRNSSFIILRDGRLFTCGGDEGILTFQHIQDSVVTVSIAYNFMISIYFTQ